MSEATRVLVVTTTMPRDANDEQARFVLDLCKSLQADFRQRVLAPAAPGLAQNATIDGIEISRFRYFFRRAQNLAYGNGLLANLRARPLRWLIVPCLLIAMVFAIRRELRQFRPAIVHAHWWAPAGLAARIAIASSRSRARLLINCHGSDFYVLGRRLPWLQKRVLNGADCVAVVSAAMLADARQARIDSERLRIAPMGVDVEQGFTPEPAVGRSGALFVGRLTSQKGIDELLHAWAACSEHTRSMGLTIVGDGPLRPRLQSMLVQLGIESSVQLPGAVSHTGLPDYLRRAALLVFPSAGQEGLGLVAIEAMACDCPVLASDIASLADVIVDGQTGYCYPQGDASALRQRLEELLERPAELRRVATSGGDAVRQRFGWAAVAANYRALYGGLLAAGH